MPLTEEQKKLLRLRTKGFKDERERRTFLRQSIGYLISLVVIHSAMTILVVIGIVYLVRFILLIQPMVKDSSDVSYTFYPIIIFIAATGALYFCFRRLLKSIRSLKNYIREKHSV